MSNSNKKTISMADKAYWGTEQKEIKLMQDKMDDISKDLNSEQLKKLDEIISWCSDEKMLDENYNDNGDN